MPMRKLPEKTHVLIASGEGKIDVKNLHQRDFICDRVPGGAPYRSTILRRKPDIDRDIVQDTERRIMYDPYPNSTSCFDGSQCPESRSHFTMRLAEPRRHVHFQPENAVIGIVTCGGLCPGLNDVIRGLTLASLFDYSVKRVVGFRYGYWGLSKKGRHTALDLTRSSVRTVHERGGTFLGSSRGPQDIGEMVDTLAEFGINILFTIGGDGTQRGAEKIAQEALRRGHDIGVFGIPKTIDNDLAFSHRTFGYETAVEAAVVAVRAVYSEACAAMYGVGIVKVMGRHSGFIAAQATVSSAQVNICLIPEMPITKEIFFKLLAKRFETSTFCIICVAEGFGQNWPEAVISGTDASGNKKLADIGLVLKKEVERWLKANSLRYGDISTCKYIDPSYMIRARPPSSSDAAFCVYLATLAVHEAMAGLTSAIISMWYDNFIVIPIGLATSMRQQVSLKGRLWLQLREMTVDLHESEEDVKREARNELLALEQHASRLSAVLGDSHM